METRCQWEGAGQSHDVCSNQCISSAGTGSGRGGGRSPDDAPFIQSSWTCNTHTVHGCIYTVAYCECHNDNVRAPMYVALLQL